MIIDHRIYATVAGIILMALWGLCMWGISSTDDFALNYRIQRATVSGFVVLALTGLAFFLDWLWS